MTTNRRQLVELRVALVVVITTLICGSIVTSSLWFLMSMQFDATDYRGHSGPVFFYKNIHNTIWAPLAGFLLYGVCVLRNKCVTLFSVTVFLAVTGTATIAWLMFTALAIYADSHFDYFAP